MKKCSQPGKECIVIFLWHMSQERNTLISWKNKKTKIGFANYVSKYLQKSEQCRDHLLSVHELGTIFDCKVCKKKQVFRKVNIRAHMIMHEKMFSCDVCGKGFSDKQILRTHFLKVHSSAEEQRQARKHICSKCPKRFYTATFFLVINIFTRKQRILVARYADTQQKQKMLLDPTRIRFI